MADIPEITMTIEAADVIGAEVDPTLSVEGMAADAKATGVALAGKAGKPAVHAATIAPEDWEGAGPYTCAINAADVTADSYAAISWRQGSPADLAADLTWETDEGEIILATAEAPAGTLYLDIITWEAIAE